MKRIAVILVVGIVLAFLSGTVVLAQVAPEESNIYPAELYVTLAPGESKVFTKTVTVNPPDPNEGNPVQILPQIPGEFKVTPASLSSSGVIIVSFDPTEDKAYVDDDENTPLPKLYFEETVTAPPGTPYGDYVEEFAFEVTADNGYQENLGKQVIHVTVQEDGEPCLPLPELPALILFAFGLVGIAGYWGFRRHKNRQLQTG